MSKRPGGNSDRRLVQTRPQRIFRLCVQCTLAVTFAITMAMMPSLGVNAKPTSATVSDERSSPKSKHKVQKPHHRFLHGPDYHPPYAEIVLDNNSGQVLHETNPDAPRHPASLTKIMTLYLLFEQLDAHKLALDSRLSVSSRASAQAPTKLGLKPNDTISVEDAIKAIVTRSANDAAVVIAEGIAGTEQAYADMMTQKAQALSMNNTVYVNASGLPAEAQVTTARDQALLARAIQERFPGYYRYFSLPSFQFRGMFINNHNALVRDMPGVDGIKTGYTEASGYNLVSSFRRNGKHIIGVVLGGRSTAARDSRMRQLIEHFVQQASAIRTSPPSLQAPSPAVVSAPGTEPSGNVALPPLQPAAASMGGQR